MKRKWREQRRDRPGEKKGAKKKYLANISSWCLPDTRSCDTNSNSLLHISPVTAWPWATLIGTPWATNCLTVAHGYPSLCQAYDLCARRQRVCSRAQVNTSYKGRQRQDHKLERIIDRLFVLNDCFVYFDVGPLKSDKTILLTKAVSKHERIWKL